MNLKPATALIALFLAACATHSGPVALPPSELDSLAQTVERQLPNRTLPNGRQYCAELAETEGEQDECLADLEALNLLRAGDRERAIGQLRRAVNRLKGARMVCRWWEFSCQAERRRLRAGGATP